MSRQRITVAIEPPVIAALIKSYVQVNGRKIPLDAEVNFIVGVGDFEFKSACLTWEEEIEGS